MFKIGKRDKRRFRTLFNNCQKTIPMEFEIFIVQPGTTKTKISDEILTLLAVTENYIMEMSNIKLNIIINKN